MQGAASHCVPGTPSRQRTFRGREGVKLGGVLEERGSASAATPKLRAELPSPLPGLPPPPGTLDLGCGGAAGTGEGGAGPPTECCGPGQDGRGAAGGGGIWNSPGGPNVVTMASAGWTGALSNGSTALPPRPAVAANGSRAARWAGPRGAGSAAPSALRLPLEGAGRLCRTGEAGEGARK